MSIAKSVVEVLLQLGVREYVVCAGARNLPIVETLVNCDSVYLWNHFEERSSGFFALGRTTATAEPCCVVTTSGTAVAEVLPAVIEAYYQARPLVILSADRPSCYRGSGAPQTIEQKGILGSYVEACIDLENDVLGRLDWSGTKPLHINVCLEEQEKIEAVTESAREFKTSREFYNVGDLFKFIQNCWDGLLVAVGGLEPEDREEVFHFLKDLKAPVVADSTSGLREVLGKNLVANPEALLSNNMIGKVLRIGDVPVGRFWRDLEEAKDVDVFSISRTGFSGLARESVVITGNVSRVLKGLGQVEEVGDSMGMLAENSKNWAKIDEMLEAFPDSEPGMVRVVSQYATVASNLYLGNSLPIREWNQFSQRDIPIEFVRANRGANGIDGQLSSWFGYSAGTDDSWCVVGDLTALYDVSALSLWKLASGERRVLVVINNGGGKIFERLPRVQSMDEEVREIVANSHELDFENIAKTWGLDYCCYTNSNEIEIEPSENGLIVELKPNADQTEAFWEALKN